MKKLLPIVSSMYYLPVKTKREGLRIRDSLLVDAHKSELSSDKTIVHNTVTVNVCDLRKRGYIGLPRHYGLSKYAGKPYIDKTISPKANPIFKKSCKIVARDDKQKEFMEALANVCSGEGPIDYIANASTGVGKTVCDLWLSAQLGLPTLIVVHTNALKNQWLGNKKLKNGISNFFTDDFVKKYVGVVQQNKCNYQGKLLVVAVLGSLISRDYGKDFYNYFGKITIDEVHKVAAPKMSEVLKKFPARIRGGYTATNKKGSMRKVKDLHLGKPKIVSMQKSLSPKVYIIKYKDKSTCKDCNDYEKVTRISKMPNRNIFLSELIYHRGWKRDRNILVLSDRVTQLQVLRSMLVGKFGVPKSSIGLFVGQEYVERLEKKRTVITKQKKKVENDTLEHIKKNCKIILSTYGMFAEGQDVPRLDMGIEATPRSDVTQSVGRIVRKHPDKRRPEWYSIYDHLMIDMPTIGNAKRMQEPMPEFKKKMEARVSCYKTHEADIKKVGAIVW
jgi:superfamily II DNA or RNA helicase